MALAAWPSSGDLKVTRKLKDDINPILTPWPSSACLSIRPSLWPLIGVGWTGQRFGGFWTGKYEVGADERFHLKWRAEYAIQQDAYDNPVDIDESYMHFVGGFGTGLIGVSAGYEVLSGTASTLTETNGQFVTTFATAHKFNGWADKFLTTPDTGLTDFYVSVNGAWDKVGYVATWHKFDSDATDAAYGAEVDAQVTYKFDWGQLVGLKGAIYSADEYATDTTKGWVFTTFTF